MVEQISARASPHNFAPAKSPSALAVGPSLDPDEAVRWRSGRYGTIAVVTG
jgi:hypothetical protein